MSQNASLILTNGQFHTLDRENSLVDAVAIKDGKILAASSTAKVMSFAGDETQIVDLKGHTVIPGLNDSHLHLIRGGLIITSNCVGRGCLPLLMRYVC